MNKVLKIDFRGQTAVLSAFVLVGMVFLVPAITEKALAIVLASAEGTCEGQPSSCVFSFVKKELIGADASNVRFRLGPACLPVAPGAAQCTHVYWETAGNGACPLTNPGESLLSFKAGCDEEGRVQWKVGGGEVSLYFKNPGAGDNKCDVNVLDEGPGKLHGTCKAGAGLTSSITYYLHSASK